jgi:hypothetical protein
MTTTATSKSSKTKVFVGNLAFKTTEQSLVDAFKTYGTVVDAKIITRGRRSLGYGFVEFATEEEAKKAIAGMDQKELDGRTLNVEEANPRPEDEANDDYNEARPRRRGYYGGFRRGGFRGRFRGYGGWYGRGGSWRGVRSPLCLDSVLFSSVDLQGECCGLFLRVMRSFKLIGSWWSSSPSSSWSECYRRQNSVKDHTLCGQFAVQCR